MEITNLYCIRLVYTKNFKKDNIRYQSKNVYHA